MEEEHTEETLEIALADLKREVTGATSRMAVSFGACVLTVLLAILGVGWLTTGQPYGMIPLALTLPCVLLATFTSPQAHSRAIDTLQSVADVRAVGPLMDLLTSVYAGKRRAILDLLTRLLPQFQGHHSTLLKPSHRNQLRTTLNLGDFQQEREYMIAILKALEQIGNGEDLELVERMAALSSGSWQERQVREAARACLPLLRTRVEQLRHQETLLRPACAGGAEDLLHPAISGADPDPAQLLRPDKTTTEERDSQVTKSA
jgi:hypothetical protein